MNSIYNLTKNDFVKGLAVAIFSAIITFLYQSISSPNFDFSSINLSEMFKFAFVAMLSYLMKNFATDKNNGKILGKI